VQGFAGKNDTIPFAQPYVGTEGIYLGQFRPTGEILQNHAAGFTQGGAHDSPSARPIRCS
jgi:hypothetical protein